MMINAKEINAIISDSLRGQLKGFSVNKSKHVAQHKHGDNRYYIGWSMGKGLNGLHYLHFWGSIRYTKIDDRYESLFGRPPGFQHLIYCSFTGVGNTSNSGQFKVSNGQDVHNALTEVMAYINKEILPLFHSLKDENDFLNYLCDSKRFFSWSETFALKRMMLATLTVPKRVDEMHNFNLLLWKDAGKEAYVKAYWKGLDQLKPEVKI